MVILQSYFPSYNYQQDKSTYYDCWITLKTAPKIAVSNLYCKITLVWLDSSLSAGCFTNWQSAFKQVFIIKARWGSPFRYNIGSHLIYVGKQYFIGVGITCLSIYIYITGYFHWIQLEWVVTQSLSIASHTRNRNIWYHLLTVDCGVS